MANLNDELDDTEDSTPAADVAPPAQAPMNPVLKQYLDNKQALSSAQSDSRRNQMLTGLARAGASLSAGLAHSNEAVDQKPFDAMAATDEQPVTDVLNSQKSAATDLANQQSMMTTQKQAANLDPNSSESKNAQGLVKKLYPDKFDDATLAGMSKTDIDQAVPEISAALKANQMELQNQGTKLSNEKQTADQDPNSPQSIAVKDLIKRLYPGKFDETSLAGMSKADLGDSVMKPLELDEKIKEHKDEMRQKNADRATAATDRATAKATADQGKALNYVTTQLESARGDGAVKQAQVDLYSTKKINSLIGLYGDPNKLTQQQVRLLADEVAKVATGGVPGEAGTEGITPNTLRGRMSTFVQNLTNSPTPANAAEFIKQYKDYAGAIANDAKSTIKSKLDAVIETHRNAMGEDNYNTVKKQYYNRYGLGDDTGVGMNQANAGDHASRAADILARRQSAKSAQGVIDNATPGFTPPPTQNPMNWRAPMSAPPDPRNVAEGFARGGTVPGQPRVPFNSPMNDTVSANLSPKEEVLPISVTQSKAPALAAYLHMKNRGYK